MPQRDDPLIALLRHHAARFAAGAPCNAVDNCHALGLASVMLHDEPGNRMRVFIASAEHDLWRNAPKETYSVAIHAHHCDVTLVGIHGLARSDEYALVPTPKGEFQRFAYRSALATGQTGTLEPTGERANVHRVERTLLTHEAAALQAHQLHTIHVPRGEAAAWLVLEGKEDPGYASFCWSNADGANLEGYYGAISGEAAAKLLNDAAAARYVDLRR